MLPANHVERYGSIGSTVFSRKSIIFYIRTYTMRGRKSSVRRATRYGAEDPLIEFGGGVRTRTNRPWISSSLLDNGHRVHPGLGVDHPSPSSAEAKERAITLLPFWAVVTFYLQRNRKNVIGQLLLHNGKFFFYFFFF